MISRTMTVYEVKTPEGNIIRGASKTQADAVHKAIAGSTLTELANRRYGISDEDFMNAPSFRAVGKDEADESTAE